MKTLKLTLPIIILTLSSFVCQAQPGGLGKGHPKRHDKGADIVRQLNLSEAQAGKLRAIHEKQKKDNVIFQEKMKVMKREKKAMKEARMKEIESILTPEQFIKFKALKKAEKEERKKNKK